MDSPPDRPLLDLSSWPAPPSAPRPSQAPLRPVRREPRGPSRRTLVVAGSGLAVLLVAGALTLGTRGSAPSCDDVQLKFGADVQAADQAAVDRARAALAAYLPRATQAPAAAPSKQVAPPKTTAVVEGPSASRLRAAEAAVASDEKQVAAAQDEYERVVAEQQQAEDPAQYDEQVAAAEEALTVAREQLADDRRALAALHEQARRAGASRSRTASAPVATKAPAPKPAATSRAPGPDRAALAKRLADAQALQADHLAARRTELERAREKGCPAR